LTSQGYQVIVLNPLQVHAYRKSGVCKRKSDAFPVPVYARPGRSTGWIANFLRIGHLPPTDRQTPLLLQLRELTRFRHHLSELLGDCKRKVLNVLERVFPEYESLFSNVFLQSFRRLLAAAVAAQEFADFDLAKLTHLLHTTSHDRLGPAQAQALQQAARSSVGASFLADAMQIEMRCLLES
jgi:transposase